MIRSEDKQEQSKADKPVSHRHLFTNIVNDRTSMLVEDFDSLYNISAITKRINTDNGLASIEKPKFRTNVENVNLQKLEVSEEEKQKLLQKLIQNIVTAGSPDDSDPRNNILFSQLFLAEDIIVKNILEVNPSILKQKYKLMTEIEPLIEPEFSTQSFKITDENTSYRLKNITITIVGVGTALLVGYLMMPAGVLFAASSGASSILTTGTAAAATVKTATAAAIAAEKVLKTADIAMKFAKSRMDAAKTFQYLDPSGATADYNSAASDYEEARRVYNEQAGIYNKQANSHTSSAKKLAESSAEIAEALLGLPNTFSIMVKVYTVISSAKQGRDFKESLEIMLKTGAREGIKFGVTYVVGAYTTSPQNAKQLEKLKTYISGKFPAGVTTLIDSTGKFIGTNYTTASTKIGEYITTSSNLISSSRVGEFVGRTAATISSLVPESVTGRITSARAPAGEAVTWLFGYMKSSAIIYATNTGLEGVMNNIEFLKTTNREQQIIKKEQDNLKLMEKQQEFMDFEFEMENGFIPTSRLLKNLYSDMKIKLDNVTKKHPYIATMMILITANYGARMICDTFINNAEGVFRYGAGWLPYGSEPVQNLITFVSENKIIKTDAVRAQIQRMIFPYLARVVNDILPLKKMIMEQVQKKLNLKADEFITIDKVVKRELTVLMLTKNIVYLLTKISTDIVQEGFIMNSMTLTREDLDKHMKKMEHWYRNYVPKDLQGVIDRSITSAAGGMPLQAHSFLTNFSNFFWNSNNADAINDLAAALGKAHADGTNFPGSSGSSGTTSSSSSTSGSSGTTSSTSSSPGSINNQFPDITPETPIKPKVEPVLGQAPYINIGDIPTNIVGMTDSSTIQKVPNVSIPDVMSQFISAAGESTSAGRPTVESTVESTVEPMAEPPRKPRLISDVKTMISDEEATKVQNIKSELQQKKEEIHAHIFRNEANIRTLNTHIRDNETNLQTNTNMLPTDIKASITEEIARLKTLRDSLNTEKTSYIDFLERIRSQEFLPEVALSSASKTDFATLKSWFEGISENPLYNIPRGLMAPKQFDTTHLPKLFSEGATHYAAYTALKNASPDPTTFREYSAAGAGEIPFSSIPIDRIKEQTLIFNQHKLLSTQIQNVREGIATLTTELAKHPVSIENSGVLCGVVTCAELLQAQKDSLAKMTGELNTVESNLNGAITTNIDALFGGKPLPKNNTQFKSLFSLFKPGTIHKNISVTPAGIISFVPGSQAQLTKYDELNMWYGSLQKDKEAIKALQSYLNKNKPTTLNDLFSGLLKNNNPTIPKFTGVAAEVEFDTNFDDKLANFKSAIDKMKSFDEQFSKTSKNLTDTKTKTDQAHHTATGVHNEVSNIAGDSREQRGKRAGTRDILNSAIAQAAAINQIPSTLTSTQTNFDAQIKALFTDIKAGTFLTSHLKTIDTTHGTLTSLETSITNIGKEVDKLNRKLLVEANKGIFGSQSGLKPETEKPKEAEEGPKEEGPKEEPVTLEGLQLYLRTKTANRLQFFLKNKNMLSDKFKDLLGLLTPEALRQKQGQALSLEEQQIIDTAHQEILDGLTGPDPRHNRAITAILDDFNLPKLNIHSFGQMLSLGKDKMYSTGTGGAIGAGIGMASSFFSAGTSLLGNAAQAMNLYKTATGIIEPLADVYTTTFQTMNTYLNLGEGALQEKARNIQLGIQQAQLSAQAVKDGMAGVKDDINRSFLRWTQGGVGFPGKDGNVDPILVPEAPLPIIGKLNIARLLLANAISGGGASARKALFEAYDVKGEVGWIYSENWDKATKMFDISQRYALISPELTPLLFGDELLKPEEIMNELQVSAARLGTYFAPTADSKIEINKITRAVMDWDMGKIAELCKGKTISSNISFLCREAYVPGTGARRSWEPWQYDYPGYLAGKYDGKKD